MPLVDVRSVSWRYSEDAPLALTEVSLALEQGEFLGVMGATGAGKTSLAQVIRGIIPGFHEDGEFTGEVVINNVDISRSDAQFTANDIGMVFQDAGSQIVGTTVIQDATFGPANLGLPKETVLERARAYLARVRLAGLDQRASHELSGGQMQRLAIAGVLAMEPQVLVLDEPVAELDPVGRREVAEILVELRRTEGATVVLLEQDPEIVAEFCDRVVIMSEGRIVAEGAPADVFADAEACLALGVYAPEAAILEQRLRGAASSEGRPAALTANELIARLDVGQFSVVEAAPAVATSAPVVELRDVSFSYDGQVKVLSDISLQIGVGEYIAVVGSNGAGKTTLSKHLNGLRRPDSGTVLINGRDIAGVETSQVALEIGYCFQNPDHQIFSRTVLEEVMFGLTCQGVGDDEAERRARNLLTKFAISDLADVNPHSLGKGQRQKVALASIVVLEPSILVIDEPTTGLDWVECQQILDIIDGFRLQGTTVIAITHDMRLVRERASRAIAMSDGEIVFDGRPVDFFADIALMRRADVEAPALSVVIAEVARRAGVELSDMPVALDDFLELVDGAVRVKELAS